MYEKDIYANDTPLGLRCDSTVNYRGVLEYAIVVALALLVVAYTVPMGLQAISEANLTGVNAIVAQFFTIVLPIMVVVSLALAFMPPEIKTKVGL